MTRPPVPRYGIAEWYGQSFRDLDPVQRQTLARIDVWRLADTPGPPLTGVGKAPIRIYVR